MAGRSFRSAPPIPVSERAVAPSGDCKLVSGRPFRKPRLLPGVSGNLVETRRRLPPLNALRAFEAAARHLNFSRAADELSVTPGAVSQQIQNLEDYVGVALFKRTPKGLLLTDAAQTALPALR